MDYDEDRIYYSYQNLQTQDENDSTSNPAKDLEMDAENVDTNIIRRHFREFLRNYRQKQRYTYRDRLLQMYQRTSGDEFTPTFAHSRALGGDVQNNTSIEVDIAHLGEYDTILLDLLLRQPAVILPSCELAAVDALETLLYEKKLQGVRSNLERDDDGRTTGEDIQTMNDKRPGDGILKGTTIQILLRGNLAPTGLREIQSNHMNTLVRCTGIVISASRVRSRATSIQLRCSRCQHTEMVHSTSGPFGSITLPSKCNAVGMAAECGPIPYQVVPDECNYVDQQTLKLQETPETVPTGEMPRSVLLVVEKGLVDKAPPGMRVTLMAIVSLFNAGKDGSSSKTVYLRVVGLQRESDSVDSVSFTRREEEAFRTLSRRPDVYDILSRSIAPSISGSHTHDIKKALTCQLFSGSRKRLPDGMRLRGDINVLLLGDPSMAKSQFLKFISKVAPIGVYTSGKGSSAAGLTASVVRDQRGEFYLEGGAMVLADGGIVAIDEFDKMRTTDRTAIHEAMEQQTISVAKAGITTVLNSRSSVLAAANPVFGRYDDFKSASENIDLMTTILSRFDLIFVIKDARDEQLDHHICHHVMGVHINNSRSGFQESSGDKFGVSSQSTLDSFGGTGIQTSEPNTASPDEIAENAMKVATSGAGELDVITMRKYIQYCKAKCKPRLSEATGNVLTSSYVKIRDDVRTSSASINSDNGGGSDHQSAVPITVRQLEALIRVSESLAKMRLDDEVRNEDVAEALRLFKVSTMAANAVDNNRVDKVGRENDNVGGGRSQMISTAQSMGDMQRCEGFLQSRLAVGATVNKRRIVEEAASQGYDATLVAKAISIMIMRGEVQDRNRGRLIKRIK